MKNEFKTIKLRKIRIKVKEEKVDREREPLTYDHLPRITEQINLQNNNNS